TEYGLPTHRIPFLPHRHLPQPLKVNLHAEAGGGGNVDGTIIRIQCKGRGNVILIVASGGGDVAGEGEAGQGGQGQLRGAADASFQHAAAPHRHVVRAAEVVHLARLAPAGDAGRLDVDDIAGADGQGKAGVVCGVDAFVQAEGRGNLRA